MFLLLAFASSFLPTLTLRLRSAFLPVPHPHRPPQIHACFEAWHHKPNLPNFSAAGIRLHEALQIYGKYMTVQEVLNEVMKDELFYRNPGGGVTVSGGEPLAQPQFLHQLLREYNRLGLHTAVETSGFAPW